MTPLEVYWFRCEGPVVFGVNDCCITVADVIVAAGGPDLMAEYRGRYSTRIGFVRAIRRAGFASLADAVRAAFDALGEAVDAPRNFDVALVTYLSGGERATSPAFYHSGFWCARNENGMFVSRGEPDQIWRVVHA